MAKTAQDVLKSIEDEDIKYVDFRFTDPRGKWRHVTFDVSIVAEGVMFDGSSIAGWKAINESDMTLMPDPETACMDRDRLAYAEAMYGAPSWSEAEFGRVRLRKGEG